MKSATMEKNNRTLTISQLSNLLNVSKPTLRYWEKEFAGILVPRRTAGGQRRYTAEHIEVVREIRSLKEAGLRIDEIRENLDNRSRKNQSELDEINFLAERVADMVKKEVARILERQRNG